MRIALLAPIEERCPPDGYGGIERVVAALAEALCARGAQVTLHATGDSRTSARLEATEPRGIRRLDLTGPEKRLRNLRHVTKALGDAEQHDLIHNHHGPMPLAFCGPGRPPLLTTLHGPMNPAQVRRFRGYHACVAISHHQRNGCGDLDLRGVVHNGIQTRPFRQPVRPGHVLEPHEWGRALVFLGRIAAEKGPHLAIRTGARLGLPVVLAGKIDPCDRPYAERHVLPEVDGRNVRFVGEVAGARKVELLQGALALLHPVRWPEPFGLVLVEAMAAGTPVVALDQGAIPEVVEHGVTGWVARDPDGLAEGVRKVADLPRERLSRLAEERYSADRMAAGYMAIYRDLLDRPHGR